MSPEPATHTAKRCSSAASETQHLHRKGVGGTPPSNAPVQQHAAQQQGALPSLLITEGGSVAHLTPHMLCVTVQRAGPLAPDLLLSSPVIRLHVVHAANGEYVRLRQQQLHPLGSSTTAGAAAGTVQESAGLSPALQAELLQAPGRPVLSTAGNNTCTPAPALLTAMPPIQTAPCNLVSSEIAAQLASNIEYALPRSGGVVTPVWEEELLLDADPVELAAADVLLLFELLQPPEGFSHLRRHAADFTLHGRCHAIAWAFIRLHGVLSGGLQEGVPLPLRLQLYRYSSQATVAAAQQDGGLAGPLPGAPARAAYLSWRALRLDGAHQDDNGDSRAELWHAGWWQGWRWCGSGAWPHADCDAKDGVDVSSAQRYQGWLSLMLSTLQRPEPGSLLVATDAAAGLRPALPAGYGSGYEKGRTPWSDWLRCAEPGGVNAHPSQGAACTATGDAVDGAVLGPHELALEATLHRPVAQACRLPNAVLVQLPTGPGGCSCIAFSHDGRWLAAAIGDAAGRYQVSVFHALSGRRAVVLGVHTGMVYSLVFSADTATLLSASGDRTACAWSLPPLPTPPGHSGTLATRAVAQEPADCRISSGSGTHRRSKSGKHVVLQHPCFVYAAELCPVLLSAPPLLLAVTAAYDGALRLWDATCGQLLTLLQVASCPLNCLAFRNHGARLYVGDAAGRLHELAFNPSVLLAAPEGEDSQKISGTDRGTVAAQDAAATAADADTPVSASHCRLRPATPAGRAAAAEAAATARSVSPIASVLRHGSDASHLASGVVPLRLLRCSDELVSGGGSSSNGDGNSITGHSSGSGGSSGSGNSSSSRAGISILVPHPDGHTLLALWRVLGGCHKRGGSRGRTGAQRTCDLALLDTKLLQAALRLPGCRVTASMARPAISPDGAYVLCGADDGGMLMWDAVSGATGSLPHAQLVGASPVAATAWSPCFHALAVSSLAPYAPLRVLCADGDGARVALKPAAAAAALPQMPAGGCGGSGGTSGRTVRLPLPEHLTPQHVHVMLRDIRTSAAQRGLLGSARDRLVVAQSSNDNTNKAHHPEMGAASIVNMQ